MKKDNNPASNSKNSNLKKTSTVLKIMSSIAIIGALVAADSYILRDAWLKSDLALKISQLNPKNREHKKQLLKEFRKSIGDRKFVFSYKNDNKPILSVTIYNPSQSGGSGAYYYGNDAKILAHYLKGLKKQQSFPHTLKLPIRKSVNPKHKQH